jgi:hypothetical protein
VRAGATAEDFMLGLDHASQARGISSSTTRPFRRCCAWTPGSTRASQAQVLPHLCREHAAAKFGSSLGIYNADNTYTGDRIPAIELIDTTGLPAWVPDAAWAKRPVVDGEPLQLVRYTGDNVVTGIGTFVARNTAMVRPSNSAQKLISSVQLWSIGEQRHDAGENAGERHH